MVPGVVELDWSFEMAWEAGWEVFFRLACDEWVTDVNTTFLELYH